MSRLAAVAIVVAGASTAVATAPAAATGLRVNSLATAWPVIDDPAPRFSWVLNHADRGQRQTAYRVVVYATPATGPSSVAWDSGVVASNASLGVVYAGSALETDTTYAWSVTWTDAAGAAAPPSANATFATSLLAQSEWAGSEWIGCPQAANGSGANQLRAEFTLPPGVAVAQARLYVVGLGYASASVNGAKAGGERLRLDPAWTIPSMRVGYSAFDVTRLVRGGGAANAVAVYLGNGWEDVSPNPFNGTNGAGSGALGDGAAADAVRELVARGAVTAGDAAAAAAGVDWSNTHPGTDFGPHARVATALRTEGGVGSLAAAFRARGAAGAPPAVGSTRVHAVRKLRLQLHVTATDGSRYVALTTARSFNEPPPPSPRGTPAAAAPPAVLPTAWACGWGAQRDDNVYDGATWDARLETVGWDAPGYAPAAAWPPAVLTAEPGGRDGPTLMSVQAAARTEVMDTLVARGVAEVAPGVFIFDLGQNFQGVARLLLPAPVPDGARLKVRHAEVLQHPPYGPTDGNIYVGNLRDALATDSYVTRASPTTDVAFEPMFTFHGFRYVELSGDLWFTPSVDTVTGVYIRSAVPLVGAVAFPPGAAGSPSVLNQFAHAATWGVGSNLEGGIQSDCCQRDERKGWMGDSALSSEVSTLLYDMCAFYEGWLRLIRDSQVTTRVSHPAGSLGDTTPLTFGNYPADPAWGTALPTVLQAHWRACGDATVVSANYAASAAWVTFLQGQANSTGLSKLYSHYGEWCPPPTSQGGGQGPKPPSALISAAALIGDVSRMVEFATALGRTADADAYTRQLATLRAQYNAAFAHADVYGNTNGDGLQTANAVSLAIGAPATPAAASAAAARLVADISTTHGGHWMAGIIGTKALHRQLTLFGYGQVAVSLMLAKDYPSLGYMFNNDIEPATTVWELPDAPTEGPGMNSRNHHMFSSPFAFLTDLAGLRQAPGSVGWSNVHAWPAVTTHADVPFGSGSIDSARGPVAVSWHNSSASAATAAFTLSVTVPVGAVGTVVLPFPPALSPASLTVTESGGGAARTVFAAGAFVPGTPGVVAAVSAVPYAASTPAAIVVEVGSGAFTFTMK